MPNWCNNSLLITGPNEELEKLLKDAEGEKINFSLAKLVPIPKELSEDWYNWRVAKWGTKWDIGRVDIEKDDGYACFNFETAWAPPVEAFNTISKNYPNLSFELTYDEPGMDFCGKSEFQNGLNSDNNYSYSDNFNAHLTFDITKSKLLDGEIYVPIVFSKKYDPYEFEKEPITVKGTMKFAENLEIDDFDAALGKEIKFEFEDDNENHKSFALNSICNDYSYDISEEISDIFNELKITARYNYINQTVSNVKQVKNKRKI